jgi:hypothetical protein
MDNFPNALQDVETPLRLAGFALFALLFARGLTSAEAPPIAAARRLLVRVFVAAALLLSLVAGFNYLVNPLGIYSTRLFEPIVLRSRSDKMRLYRSVNPPPEIVVLGSSSSFSMPPAYIRERTGRPAFNASLHGGVPEDYLAFLRYLVSLDKIPRLLIVPLSVELLRPNLPRGFEPNNPLAPFLEKDHRDLLDGPRRLVSLDQTRASLRLLAADRRGRPPAQYRFDADGWGHFAQTDAPLERIVENYMATKEWGPALFSFQHLDGRQLSYFREFLALARRLGVKVIVYVPPLYPKALAFYEKETNLPVLREELLGQLQAWRAEGLIVSVHDFTRLESFGGRASEFADLAHPTAEASRRMLDRIFQEPLPTS